MDPRLLRAADAGQLDCPQLIRRPAGGSGSSSSLACEATERPPPRAPGVGGRVPSPNMSCDDKTFGPKKIARRSPASSHSSTVSSSANYLVVKVGLGGFQGKFKLLWLQRRTHGSAGVHLRTCGTRACVWLPVAQGGREGWTPRPDVLVPRQRGRRQFPSVWQRAPASPTPAAASAPHSAEGVGTAIVLQRKGQRPRGVTQREGEAARTRTGAKALGAQPSAAPSTPCHVPCRETRAQAGWALPWEQQGGPCPGSACLVTGDGLVH